MGPGVGYFMIYKNSGREGHGGVAKLRLILSDLWPFQLKRSYNVSQNKNRVCRNQGQVAQAIKNIPLK